MAKKRFAPWLIALFVALYFGSLIKSYLDIGFQTKDLTSLIVGIVLAYLLYKSDFTK